jgi:D-3-phosphoglycerate dehydrogenase
LLAGYVSGQVGNYATDVYVKEPPQMTPLLQHSQTILTPHAGGFTEESVARATSTAVENILEVLEHADACGN